ncbi:MAG: hypothetical protein R2940_18460 [Syntrophotaleaceae bacterium]
MKPIRITLEKLLLGPAIMLLVAACTGAAPPEPIFFDIAAWDSGIRTIALTEVSYAPRYQPPTDYDLERDLRIFLRRELERKGYQVVVVGDEWNRPNTDKQSAEQLVANVPTEADAAVALHVDFLFLPSTLGETNPPPSAEIAAEARLITREPVREIWRDWADATAGGAGGWPVASRLFLYQQAVQELADRLFDTLPDAGKAVAGDRVRSEE